MHQQPSHHCEQHSRLALKLHFRWHELELACKHTDAFTFTTYGHIWGSLGPWLCKHIQEKCLDTRICPKEAVTLWEDRAGADFLAGLVTPVGTNAGAVCKELKPLGRTHIGEFHRGLSLVGGTREEEGEESFLWGGRSGRDSMCWIDHNTHSVSPCATDRKEVKKLGMKLYLGRRERWGESVFPINLLQFEWQ